MDDEAAQRCASGPEWPVIEATLSERARIGRKRLTADFFNRAIGTGLQGARVERVRVLRDRLLGLSGSQLRKCELFLSDGRVLRVVVKAPLRGLEQEILFYCDLAPHVPVRVPRAYGVAPNPEPRRSAGDLLILEALPASLSPAEFNPGHLGKTACAIAKLHARFMNQSLEVFAWLPDAARSQPAIFRPRLDDAIRAIRKREESLPYFPALIGVQRSELLARAADEIDRVLEALRTLPPTLLHGDLNPANIMVPAQGDPDLEEIALVDWQNVCRGPGIFDLVYLHNMSRFRGSDSWGRPVFGEPLMQWDRLAQLYLDALESELGSTVDRAAYLAAAPAADISTILRLWIPFTGLILDAARADFLWGRFGWIFRPLLRWARVDRVFEYFLVQPVARLIAEAPATGLFEGGGNDTGRTAEP